jgi:cytochrome c oxidase subunit 3
MNQVIGTINTGVLLVSSFTVVLAVAAAEAGKSRRAAQFLLTTIVLALIFLGFKAYEYYHEYEQHLIPFAGFDFQYNDPNPAEGEASRTPAYAPAVRIYLFLYFTMTGIHATHMLVGIGVFAVVAFQAWRNRYNAEYYNPIEVSGLYWHFVDIVWIFLFPLLYLLH